MLRLNLFVKQIGIQGVPRIAARVAIRVLAVKHGQWFQWFGLAGSNFEAVSAATNGLGGLLSLLFSGLFKIVNKMASGSIRAKTYRMVGSTEVGFIFGMSSYSSQFSHTVSKLAFFSILASTVF